MQVSVGHGPLDASVTGVAALGLVLALVPRRTNHASILGMYLYYSRPCPDPAAPLSLPVVVRPAEPVGHVDGLAGPPLQAEEGTVSVDGQNGVRPEDNLGQ